MNIGEKIYAIRKRQGMSQEELADKLDVARQTISRWESGAMKPDIDKIALMCSLFGVSADYFIGETEEVKDVALDNASVNNNNAPNNDRVEYIPAKSVPVWTLWTMLVPCIIIVLSCLIGVLFTLEYNENVVFNAPEFALGLSVIAVVLMTVNIIAIVEIVKSNKERKKPIKEKQNKPPWWKYTGIK